MILRPPLLDPSLFRTPIGGRIVGPSGPPRFSQWAFLGDSITQQFGTLTRFETRGYGPPLRFRLRQRMRIVPMVSTQHDDGIRYNHGYGTYSPSQILNGTMTDAIGASPVQPMADIAASNPPAVFVFCGSNPGSDVAATAADIIAIWDTLRAAGRFVAGAEVLPRSAAQGATATANIYAVNAILGPAADARGIPFVRWASAFANPSSPEGYAKPAYVAVDGVHPNSLGGVVLSELAEPVLLPHIALEEPTYPSAGGAWVTPNAGFVDGNSDGYADSITFPGAVISAASVIPATGGNWQRITSNHSSNTGQVIRNTSGVAANGWAVGDWVQATCEIRVPAPDVAAWNFRGIQCEMVKTGGTTTTYTDMFQVTNTMSTAAEVLGKPLTGRFLTPPFQIPGDATGIFAYLRFWGSGTFEFRNLGVFKA
jgi:lysophospholipase L1-like esterase